VSTAAAWSIRRYGTVDSTQAIAAGLLATGVGHRTVVIAERQTAGFGRKGDAWQDIPGASLLLTLILRPTAPASIPRYAMIAGLAGLDAIRETTGLRGGIKWPNDLLLNGRKVAGILGDAVWRGDRLEAVRLGIGVNLGGEHAAFAARALPDATSIEAESGCRVDRDAFLRAFLAAFARWEDAKDAAFGARRCELGRRRLREQAAVARPFMRLEDGDLPLEPVDRAVHDRNVAPDRCVVHEVPRREVVGAVDDQVPAGVEDPVDVLGGEALAVGDHVHVGVERADRPLRRIHLRRAERVERVHDLALQVRLVDDVGVDDPERADTGRREVEGCR